MLGYILIIVTCLLNRVFSLLLEPDMQRAQLIYQEIRKSSLKILTGFEGWGWLYLLFNIFLSCTLFGCNKICKRDR